MFDCYSQFMASFNFKRSSLSFSPNVHHALKQYIKQLFGLVLVLSHQKYFCFPSLLRQSKIGAFNELKLCVILQIVKFRLSLLLMGVRQLIKAIVQVIPSYMLWVFYLLVSWLMCNSGLMLFGRDLQHIT